MIDSVMVDAVRYKVSVLDGPLVGNGHEASGTTDFNVAQIDLRKDVMDSGSGAKLLMHEIVHAILYERGMQEDIYNNEGLVDIIATGVINLIRQNPDLVRLIVEG